LCETHVAPHTPSSLYNYLHVASFSLRALFRRATKPESSPKPKVRAITAFINLDRARYQIQISEAVRFLKYAPNRFRVPRLHR